MAKDFTANRGCQRVLDSLEDLNSLPKGRGRLEALEASLSWRMIAPLSSGLDHLVSLRRELKHQGLAKLRGRSEI